MKPKAFWTYAAFGLLCFGLTFGIAYLARGAFRENLPAYRAHLDARQRVLDWYAQRNLDMRQVAFDQVLAGRADLQTLGQTNARLAAESLRTLVPGDGADTRVKAVRALLFDTRNEPMAAWMQACHDEKRDDTTYRVCVLDSQFASLANPERLGILLGTDEAAKRAALPDVPEGYRSLPAWQEDQPRWQDFPTWTERYGRDGQLIGLWVLASIVFVFGFAVSGTIFFRAYGDEDDEDGAEAWQRPIARWPHFILGWAVMLAFAPGFLLFKTLRLLAVDFQPGLRRIWNAVRRRTFASEHERTLAHLDDLRAKASTHEGSEDTVRLIDATVAKVKEAKDLEELDKLRKVAIDIQCAHEAKIEIEQTLSA